MAASRRLPATCMPHLGILSRLAGLVAKPSAQAGAATESGDNELFAKLAEAMRQAGPRNALVGAMPVAGGPPPTAPLFEAASAGHLRCVKALLEGTPARHLSTAKD